MRREWRSGNATDTSDSPLNENFFVILRLLERYPVGFVLLEEARRFQILHGLLWVELQERLPARG